MNEFDINQPQDPLQQPAQAPMQEAVVPPAQSTVSVESIGRFAAQIEKAVDQVVMGQPGIVRHIFVALLVQGHILLEGNPGTAKTLLIRTIGKLCNLKFRRIQFTPDLMPSDITGTSIFRPDSATFEFREGPVFTQLLLADEINRAPARTQAALLQAMQERIVTADGQDMILSDAFTVIATQNPLENEGTYPLPEAELDRFLFKLDVNYPSEQDELRIFQMHGVPKTDDLFSGLAENSMLGEADLIKMRKAVMGIEVSQGIANYALQIIRQTREHPFLVAGASTRAGVMLIRAARALAATHGRMFVVPDDIRNLAPAALRHRLYRTAAAELEGTSTDTILHDIISRVQVPR